MDGQEVYFRKDLILCIKDYAGGAGIEMLGVNHPGYVVRETVAEIREMMSL
jgi:hypothetical protein